MIMIIGERLEHKAANWGHLATDPFAPRRKTAIVGQLLSIYHRKNVLQESVRTNPLQSE